MAESDKKYNNDLTREFEVAQHAATERPFSGKYDDFYEDGIYVDVVRVNHYLAPG